MYPALSTNAAYIFTIAIARRPSWTIPRYLECVRTGEPFGAWVVSRRQPRRRGRWRGSWSGHRHRIRTPRPPGRVLHIDAAVVDRLQSRGYEAVFPQDMPRQGLDVTIICVNTPTVGGAISLSRLDAACETVGSILGEAQGYHLVVVRSTLPPGTTEERVIPRLEARSGRRVGREFGVCYHPEFLRESSAVADFGQAWMKVYGGYDARSRRALRGLYDTNGSRSVTEHETDIRTAEMTG